MKKLIVKKIEKNNCFVKDEENNEYFFHIELYDIIDKIEVNDILYMSDKLIKDINNFVSSFGALDSKYGRENPSEDEILVIMKNNKNIRLKRLYG